ncbi:MAG: hypothetical protein P0Y49_04515 [Candidatus Pedobacter colombiensis]|uniref:Uncharacterized protein n=1 Tax=Candidatus Pedobacter colombiensis TaxID=3121371 RepID=A0AAJ6B7K9_9SPHI|nr:hypothetical protein [Pedobacter sp.]WEK20400.1 MAG: hypothetical protein P0Y49_04515 [Pedobacter sp.]
MGYETRVVAFIDILGFKNAIDKSDDNEDEYLRILNTLTELKDTFIRPKDEDDINADRYLGADTQIVQVSDSLVISRLIQERGGIYYMISDCALAIHTLIRHGFLCRGAITAGNMFHNGTTLFGSAFVEAYQTEANEILPIIKFNNELLDIVKHFPGIGNEGYEDWEIDFIKKNCKALDENNSYINYFSDYNDRYGEDEGSSYFHYHKLREILVKGLELPIGSNAHMKFEWASKQFNIVADSNGQKKIEI